MVGSSEKWKSVLMNAFYVASRRTGRTTCHAGGFAHELTKFRLNAVGAVFPETENFDRKTSGRLKRTPLLDNSRLKLRCVISGPFKECPRRGSCYLCDRRCNKCRLADC